MYNHNYKISWNFIRLFWLFALPLPITLYFQNRITGLFDSYLTLTRSTRGERGTVKVRSLVECRGRGVCQRQGSFIANDRTWTRSREFPQNSVGFGEAGGLSRSAMLRIRCARRGLMTAASIIWSFWANGQITGAGRDYCYYIAAADSVESWLYFSQSLSPDLDPFVRLSARRSRSPLLSSSRAISQTIL